MASVCLSSLIYKSHRTVGTRTLSLGISVFFARNFLFARVRPIDVGIKKIAASTSENSIIDFNRLRAVSELITDCTSCMPDATKLIPSDPSFM